MDEQQPPLASQPQPDSQNQPIDLQQLADKVYRLMQEELRLEQARAGRLGQRKERRR
ncbi:MAG: hypothetical protein MUD01_14825 [Chloroflexaceae bacterium]|jgi:hypothetical protein|nr:hypothetical protein [Chloroflexaceae bacterium]